MLISIMAVGCLVFGAVGVAAFVMRESSEFKELSTRVSAAEKFYTRETERASEYSRTEKDRIEANDLRYTALKERVEKIESLNRPMNVNLHMVDLADDKEKAKAVVHGVKKLIPARRRESRPTQ